MSTPRIAILRAVLLLSAITIGMAPLTAAAGQTGACSVFATSTNSGSADLATTSTWHVREADTITIRAASTYTQRQLSMQMLLYGIPIGLESVTGSANGGRETVVVNNFSWIARVFALSASTNSCNGSATMVIDDRSATNTLVGGLGLIFGIVGLIGLLAVAIGRQGWIGGAMLGGLSALGFGLLLQQTQILDPRNLLDLLVPVAGLLIGAGLCAVVRPSASEQMRQRSVA